MRRYVVCRLEDDEEARIVGSVDDLHTVKGYGLEAIDTKNGGHYFYCLQDLSSLEEGWQKFDTNIDDRNMSKYLR